jgi:hypothetical protein
MDFGSASSTTLKYFKDQANSFQKDGIKKIANNGSI